MTGLTFFITLAYFTIVLFPSFSLKSDIHTPTCMRVSARLLNVICFGQPIVRVIPLLAKNAVMMTKKMIIW